MGLGRWQIVLERIDGSERLEAQDCEPEIHRDRLALLAVVRGWKRLEQAGHVRLVTTSRYVDRGLRFGLPNWRDTNYRWESFGSLQPIRNADLWQRVDVAMQYHAIVCRWLKPHPALVKTVAELSSSPAARRPRQLAPRPRPKPPRTIRPQPRASAPCRALRWTEHTGSRALAARRVADVTPTASGDGSIRRSRPR